MNTCFNEDFLVSAPSYEEVMDTEVLPRLKERELSETVPGFEDRPLYCVSWQADHPVGTVYIVHGFTENAFKYAELVWSLLNLHFSVVSYDQRGHGRSWRAEGIADPSVTHVDHFSDYVKDLEIVCSHFGTRMPQPALLFAHSMGGAVAALYLEQHPGFFSGCVLSSPMIAPNLGGVPPFLALSLASAADLLGKGRSHPFFMKPYSGPEDFASSCATDPARFAWYDRIKANRKEFRNSIPSYHWSSESIRVTEKILAPGAPEKINCPVLLFTAEIDSSVLPDPQKSFISRIRNGRQVLVSRAKHEIYRSSNDVLFPWWHEVIAFFRHSAVPD